MHPLLAAQSNFDPASRIWVYTTDRPLDKAEIAAVEAQASRFCVQWTAHNQALKATAEVFGGNALLIMVDETQAGASGCSIDKSVHFLEDLGQSLGVNFFERMRFAWLGNDDQLHWADKTGLQKAIEEGRVHADTPMLNTLVQTRGELSSNWWVPFGKSWHRRVVS